MKLPDEPQNWLANISLLYPFESQLTITPAWSLRVERVYYFALIFLSRNIKIVICWLLFSAIYILYLEYSFAPFNEKYNTVFGASISFSLGALTYHLSKKISLGKSHLYIALVLFSMHLWFAPDIWNFSRENIGFDMLFKPEHYGLYSCIILGAYLLLAIISNDVNSQLSSLGVYFGYLAYSVFLIHWVVAIFVVGIGISFDEKLNFLLVSFALINIMSLALYWFIERPINNNIRFKLREGELQFGIIKQNFL
jgi:peptidoglycan/LPS O-acetylase OafA/YrhL